MMNVPLTIGGILAHARVVHANVEIVSRLLDLSWHRSTVGEFAGRVARLASMLHDLGLRPGDRVASLMWNHYAHLEAYFAIPAAGGVTHTLNPRMSADSLAYVANHGGARILVARCPSTKINRSASAARPAARCRQSLRAAVR
jgi:fatty-acyl-CoA synthase